MNANIEGRIGFIKSLKKGGISIAIAEPKNNHLQKTSWHRVVAWGEKAKAMKSKISVGQTLRCTCNVTISTKNEKQFINLIVGTWTLVQKPKYTFETNVPTQRDDDWFVPEPKPQSQTAYDRRYEGFEGRP